MASHEDKVAHFPRPKMAHFVKTVDRAAPSDVKHTAQANYIDNAEYVEISIKTIEGDIIDGKVNLQVFRNLDDMLRYTSLAPFVILINAHDSRGNFHHTLFVNKTAIVQIEGGLQLSGEDN